jgi:hypothetical protein
MQLVEGIEGENHVIFSDRYYTSPQLLADLKQKKIGAVGTVQINRLHLDNETAGKIQSLPDRQIKYFRGPSDLLLLAWKDHKTVLCLSSYHNPDQRDRLRKKDRSGKSAFLKSTSVFGPLSGKSAFFGPLSGKSAFLVRQVGSQRFLVR